MNYFIIILVSFGVPAIVLFVLALYFFTKEKDKQKNCIQKTIGTVFRYSFMDNDLCLPLVEYFVDGKRYIGKRKWRSYKVIRTASIKQSTAESNIEQNTLTLRGNAFFMENPMKKLYPIGTQVDVYYNPSKPKENYVQVIEKRASIIGIVLLLCSIGIPLIGVGMYFLIMLT